MARPKAEINWKTVEDLLICGCPGTDIAEHFGLHPNTIYERCEQDHGITFSEYSSYFYAKGANLLRQTQYLKAIGKSDSGDNTLLIWLGKTRLKQKENDESIQQSLSDIAKNLENLIQK